MAHPYLRFPRGRGGIGYPNYERDGIRIPLVWEGRRLKEGDPKVDPAYLLIHESWEAGRRFDDDKKSSVCDGSIAHAIDLWHKEEVVLLATGTQKLYRQFAKEIRDAHGHRPAATMPRDAVVMMISDRKKETPGAAKNLKGVLSVLFSFIEDHPATFHLPDNWRNPTIGRRKRGKRGQHEETGWLPWEEWQLRQFRRAWPFGTVQRVLMEALLATGQRTADVAAMRRQDIHDGEIAVAQQKTKARVWILVSDALGPVLDQWMASHPHDALFPGATGKPLSANAVQQLMYGAIRKAGLPVACVPHGLRYTFATRAVELNLDRLVMEAIVGHTTMQMARKYTEKRRDARLTIETMNRGLPVYHEDDE